MSGIPTTLPPRTTPATDVISRKIFINGTELNKEIRVSQITINRTFNKIASAKLQFLDGAPAQRDFPLSNDNKFKPGCEIKIQLGYHGDVKTVFKGIIVKHSVKIRQRGGSLLFIEAKDKAIKLTAGRKSKYFIDKTDEEVIKKLAKDFTPEVDGTQVRHKQLVQYDATDWDFLLTRAEANGMLVMTDDGKLVAKKPATSGTSILTAIHGQNIWEFEAEMDARRQYGEVKSTAWNFSEQALVTSGSGSANFTENGNFSSSELAAVVGAKAELNHSGYLKKDQLQDWSNAYAMRNHLTKCVGRVRIKGNADVKPGTIIKLQGVGSRFNGNVFVTGVMHHYEGQWQSDIQFGWRDEWFYKKENIMDRPAAGLLPGINGLQIGVVTETEDTESGGQYRVKVHVATITSSKEGIWARVATLDAGKERGSYFRPEKDDEVILGFLNDDPRDAIILGCLHSKEKRKSPLPETTGNKESGFVTKEKLKLVFDDTAKKMTLLVPAANGNKSIVLAGSGALELKDEHNNSIKMDASGITIKAGTGKNIIINGAKVFIN
jgi:Rhs element Vgr protein